jgi:hypothetical protein
VTDNLYESLLKTGQGKKVFRRKRKSRGIDFSGQDPPTIQETHRGEWCRRCKMRHPYNGAVGAKLVSQYEKRGKAWVLCWLCPVSGDHVGELWLVESKEIT